MLKKLYAKPGGHTRSTKVTSSTSSSLKILLESEFTVSYEEKNGGYTNKYLMFLWPILCDMADSQTVNHMVACSSQNNGLRSLQVGFTVTTATDSALNMSNRFCTTVWGPELQSTPNVGKLLCWLRKLKTTVNSLMQELSNTLGETLWHFKMK